MLSRSISFLALLFHVLEAHPPVLFNSSLLCQDISYLECRYNIMNDCTVSRVLTGQNMTASRFDRYDVPIGGRFPLFDWSELVSIYWMS